MQWFLNCPAKTSGSVDITTDFTGTDTSSICLNSMIISTIATSTKRFMPYFAIIWVNITSMDICKCDVTSSFPVYLILVRNYLCCTEEYSFLSKIIAGILIPSLTAALFGLLLSTWGSLLLELCVLLTMDAFSYCTPKLISSVYDYLSSLFTYSVTWSVLLSSSSEMLSSI